MRFKKSVILLFSMLCCVFLLNTVKADAGTISANINNQTKTLKVPVLSNLKVRFLKYSYSEDTHDCYYYVKLTNKSSRTITSATFRCYAILNDEYIEYCTVKLNLKPGKSKTVKINIGKLFDTPEEPSITCTKFWYRK